MIDENTVAIGERNYNLTKDLKMMGIGKYEIFLDSLHGIMGAKGVIRTHAKHKEAVEEYIFKMIPDVFEVTWEEL